MSVEEADIDGEAMPCNHEAAPLRRAIQGGRRGSVFDRRVVDRIWAWQCLVFFRPGGWPNAIAQGWNRRRVLQAILPESIGAIHTGLAATAGATKRVVVAA